MNCVRCGKEIADGSLICPLCDALQVRENRKVCKHCGAIMDKKYNVCPICRKAQDRFYDEEDEDVPEEKTGAEGSVTDGGYDDYDGEEDYFDEEDRAEDAKGLWGRVFLILLGILAAFVLGVLVGQGRIPLLPDRSVSVCVDALPAETTAGGAWKVI